MSETEKRKILLLSPQPFFIPRGTPINVREIIYSLTKANYEVTLLAYPFGDSPEIKNLEITRSPGIPFINSVKAGPSLSKILLDLVFFIKAIYLSLRNRYDLFHGIEEGGFIAGLLGLIQKKPFIVDVDSSMSSQLQESGFIKSKLIINWFEKVEAFFANRANKVITVCQSLTEDILRISPQADIVQIEDFPIENEDNSSEGHEFNLRTNYSIEKDSLILLYAGNLEPYQGIDLLLHSYHLVKANPQVPPNKLVIVGGSPEDIHMYREITKQLKIDSSVIFTGTLPPSQISSILKQADLLLSPRIKGTNTPLKIYGYMNSGIPIIATNILSHTQVLSNSNAFLGDTQAENFSQSILEALGQDKRQIEARNRRASEAKKLAESKYSRERFRDAIQNTYMEIFKKIHD